MVWNKIGLNRISAFSLTLNVNGSTNFNGFQLFFRLDRCSWFGFVSRYEAFGFIVATFFPVIR